MEDTAISNPQSAILYSCPFVPAEWIAAHGLLPCRELPGAVDTSLPGTSAGVCPYAAAFLGQALRATHARGIIVTTVCDQMRRLADLLERESAVPVFLLNVPSTWESAAARALYRAELERLGAFLIARGGIAPAPAQLAAIMRQFEDNRGHLLAKRKRLTGRQFAETLADFYTEPASARAVTLSAAGPPPHVDHRVPLALIGVPLLRDSFGLLDQLEAAGGRIVLHATESGEMMLPAPFDAGRMATDPLDALAHAYFDRIPHVCRRPNDGLYAWLANAVAERDVRGIVMLRYLWCDLWQAEKQRIQTILGLPLLELDLTAEPGGDARFALRIQAFIEMLT